MVLTGLSSSVDALSTIASTIQQVEGYYPPGTPGYPSGSLAYRNNNPGNLVLIPYYASAFGATQGAGGYAAFPDYSTGYAALQHQIQVDAAAGLTFNSMIYKYLGHGTGGDYVAYAATIANALGVSPDSKVSDALTGVESASTPLPVDGGMSTPDPSEADSGPSSLLLPILTLSLFTLLLLRRE